MWAFLAFLHSCSCLAGHKSFLSIVRWSSFVVLLVAVSIVSTAVFGGSVGFSMVSNPIGNTMLGWQCCLWSDWSVGSTYSMVFTRCVWIALDRFLLYVFCMVIFA